MSIAIRQGLCRNASSFPGCRRGQSRGGWTLVETMVAMLVGALIFGAVLAATMFVRQTFVAVGSYTDLNRASRNTLDVLSRDIRNAAFITYMATNLITLSNLDTTMIVYYWDPAKTTFTRSNIGGVRVMLTNCDYLCIQNYQRNPSNGFMFYPVGSSTNQTKLLDVSWHCMRAFLGTTRFTESVQTAKVVTRN
jgi:hypothetical protein